MFVLELYFILYRVPKIMTRLAREQGRSALAWSFAGIGAWIGAEFAVLVTTGVIYEIGVIAADWPSSMPAGLKALAYLAALVAALLGVTFVQGILTRLARRPTMMVPPPPPKFASESESAG